MEHNIEDVFHSGDIVGQYWVHGDVHLCDVAEACVGCCDAVSGLITLTDGPAHQLLSPFIQTLLLGTETPVFSFTSSNTTINNEIIIWNTKYI